MEKEVTIIIPVFNEANQIEQAVASVKSALDRIGLNYDIIIAEDGSTDKTPEICDSLRGSNVKVMHSKKRLGRGMTLKNAIRVSESRIVVYMDVDLATDLKHIPQLISEIENGAVIATGSRLMGRPRVSRSMSREVFSKGYNFLVRLLTGSKIHDHQCGFKAFDREKILPLLDEVKDNHWFWDTELLVLAQKKGLKVSEIPVEWHGSDGSKVNLVADALDMGMKLIRLKLNSL